MERRANIVRLRPGMEGRYRELHAAVWPEVRAAMERAQMTNYTIFYRDGLLVSYFEYTGTDFERDREVMAAQPEVQRWWALTAPCQERLETAGRGQLWVPAEELFHLD
ncbi:L-rhamnose mutarotase [Psychromicrobium xiongbiense]|uniref:L-rhamnose mutarotase n=1 Tax=Psychromicrobium xiongbiense TaxID=3051184 RepID=UPI0025539587|nr:L-rhamnose mutarotase [Psychromicrobium sp. YIM S02556]